MNENEEKFWRSLVRVVDLSDNGNSVWLCVSGWNSDVAVLRPVAMFPKALVRGQRFFAGVNTGTDDPDELQFKDFEFPIDGYPSSKLPEP